MIVNRQLILGKVLVAVGCLWLFLILFDYEPPFLSLFSSGEYLVALATVASGLTFWRRGATGRWPPKMILAVLALFIVGTGTQVAIKKRSTQKKEADYQSALSEYQQALRPGMMRKEVEDDLRAKNVDFRQMCCVEPNDLAKRHTWDDLVKIGEEEHPWFCSEQYVYIAFQFTDHVQIQNGHSIEDDNSDVLKAVSIFHQLGGCL